MLRPGFVPPPQIRRLRDLTRYRADLVGARFEEQITPFADTVARLDEILGISLAAAHVILAAVLGNAGAAKTGIFPGEPYRRIARRRGSKRAIVAVGRSILVIAWHLLSDPEARFTDLGPGFYATPATPNAASAGTSARSKPSAAKSPSGPPTAGRTAVWARRGAVRDAARPSSRPR
jgi:hypothetical protein